MSVSESILRSVVRLVPRRDRVDWVCPVCGSVEQVSPYEREYRIGHAEACDHCNGGGDD